MALSSGKWAPVVFIISEKYDDIMNGRLESWCFRLARNWSMGNQKTKDSFDLTTVLSASVRNVKLEPSIVGAVWVISLLDAKAQGHVQYGELLSSFDPTDTEAFFLKVDRMLYFDRSLRVQAEAFVRSLGARL